MEKNITEKTRELLKELDVNKLKQPAKRNNVLIQQLLQELMLSYIVDIREQTLLKQNDLASTYPTDLVSSLKIFADLYFKIKNENRNLKKKDNEDIYESHSIF
jgi:hypothetical protein